MPVVHAPYPRQTRRQPVHPRRRARVFRRHLRPHPLQHRPREEPDLASACRRRTCCRQGALLLNMQMGGMLLGGLLWGILGDRRGRLSVLFGSIFLYSAANIANAFVDSVGAYAVLRLIAGHRAGRRARRGHHARQRGDVEGIARLRHDDRRRRRHHRRGRRGAGRRLLRLAHRLHRRRRHGHRAARAAHRRLRVGHVRTGEGEQRVARLVLQAVLQPRRAP